jgi:RNA polymerase sigma factor (sigma-70 family)
MKLPFRPPATPPGPSAHRAPAEPAEAKPDGELAKAAQRGEKRAFVEIVARHQAMVCGIAFGILGDFAASEDAAQEAFLTAWRKIHDLREPERLKAWLSQITRNAALGHLRRRHPERSLDEALEAADPALHPDEATASDEEAALVREALTKLPETFRMPLILFYRDGQSVKSVAEALELSEDAVKQRLARGREMLRERMSGVIESVLSRTRPTAVFTMMIAAAIGALAAPAVIAGAAFTTAAASVSSTTATTAVTAMSTSKTSLTIAALVAAACLPLGYGARLGLEPPPPKAAAGGEITAAEKTGGVVKKTDFSNSALYAEWIKLHDEHGSSADDMPALYKAISEIKDPVRRRVFRAAQIAEWAEMAPEAGFAYFMEKGRDAGQCSQFFDEWLQRDAAAAANALVNAGSQGDRLARRCLVEIAKQAPGRVAELAARLPKGENYWSNEVRDAFAILAAGELDSARSAAESLAGENREAALSGVAKAWAKTDPDAAIAWAKGLPEGVDRDELIRGALTGLAAVNPAAALDRVQSIPPGGKQGYFATTTGARVLKEAAAADYDATVAWLAKHPKLSHDDMMGMADAVTGRLNANAAAFLEKHHADGALAALMPAVSSALINQASGQGTATWEWLKSQPDSAVIKELKQQVINSASYMDPAGALKLVNDFPQTDEGNEYVKMLAMSLMNGGQRLASIDQLLAQAPERMHEPLMESALMCLGSDTMDDPQKWLAMAAKAPEKQQADWTARAVSAWAGKEPEEALAWASALPAGNVRSAAWGSAANAWIRQDAYGASEWLDTQPPGPDKDQASAVLVQTILKDSPAEAWEWALSLSDPPARISLALRVLDEMGKRDPAAARQWLEAADFPAESKNQMREMMDRAGNAPGPVTPPNYTQPSGNLPAPR